MTDFPTQKDIDNILNQTFFPKNCHTMTNYSTSHDDNDGDSYSGFMDMIILSDGDVCIKTHHKGIGYLRFRTSVGGGRFQKIRNALLILSDAIRQEGRME